MREIDAIVRESLEELAPFPSVAPDWPGVVREAHAAARRRLVLAAAAVVAALVTATAVASAVGGFESWLRGLPGSPASDDDQRGFATANGRSWASFPTGTELRKLVETEVEGRRFALYGFRSGDTLCLRLRAVSLGKTAQSCAPRSWLARVDAPVAVATADHTFYDRAARPTAQVSFGFAADDVRRVDLDATDGRHRATVGGNAYLLVLNEPNTTNRVLRLHASGDGPVQTTLQLTQAYGGPGLWSSGRPVRGPSVLEARIAHPRVAWHVRRENRGVSIDDIPLTDDQRTFLRSAAAQGHLRLVKPDPLSDIVVGLSGALCQVVVGGIDNTSAVSCSPAGTFFSRGAVNTMGSGSSSEFLTLTGVAADGVSRIRIFLADGQTLSPPLRHNLFAARLARTQLPYRVVAYDRLDRIVGINTQPRFREPIPPRARQLRVVDRVRGPNGAAATLSAGPTVDDYRCWRVQTTLGQSAGGCDPTAATGPKIAVDLVQPAGRDMFIVGRVHPVVVRVTLDFADGTIRSTRPRAGHFIFAVPRSHLTPTRQRAYVRGYDRQGHRVQRQGIYFRSRD